MEPEILLILLTAGAVTLNILGFFERSSQGLSRCARPCRPRRLRPPGSRSAAGALVARSGARRGLPPRGVGCRGDVIPRGLDRMVGRLLPGSGGTRTGETR